MYAHKIIGYLKLLLKKNILLLLVNQRNMYTNTQRLVVGNPLVLTYKSRIQQ